MNIRLKPCRFCGEVTAISSKSDAHRLLIASALSDRSTFIRCNARSADITATVNCLNSLGADINFVDGGISVKPIKEKRKSAVLDCNESGSTIRFLLPVAASLGTTTEFTGGGRLPERPLSPLREQMEAHGVVFSPINVFPVKINGKMISGKFTIKGNISSQFITGLLFALPLLNGNSIINVIPPVESRPYIDMTLNTLKKFGITVTEKSNSFFIPGGQKYASPGTVESEGDWSNSAFFLTAGAVSGKVTVTGLDVSSVQGDKQILTILKEMGAEITVEQGSITVKKGDLHGINIDARNIPDLVPIISVAAAAANDGETVITGAERLKIKESDRLTAVYESLKSLGVDISKTDDGLVINKTGIVGGGAVSGYNDHRMVMALSVLSAVSSGDIILRGAEAVNKSYPNFFEDFSSLGGSYNVINS
ncbi:MAG: 3-phosphoshikimate 1-carboxyvinyltransferase [Acutalibacteraceae bacterium]|jgi:3-phosphoshikimate 1-carboxyvinyltransferase